MLKRTLATAAASLSLAIAASVASAQDIRDFDVVNLTSASIDSVYVSPSAARTWGSNILTEQVRPGQVLHVTFNYPSPGVCQYDIYVSYTDGDEDEWDGLNLCSTNRIVINDDSAHAE